MGRCWSFIHMLLINVRSWAIPTIFKFSWFVHWTGVFLVCTRQSFSPFWTIILGTSTFPWGDLLTDFQGIQYLERDQVPFYNHLLRVLYFPHSCDLALNLHVIDIVDSFTCIWTPCWCGECMILCAAMNVSYAWHFTIMKEIIWHTLKGSGIKQIWQNVLHVKLRMRLHSPSLISARSILGKQVRSVTLPTLPLTTFSGMLSLHGPKYAIEVNLLKL